MIKRTFETKIKIQDVIENQLPEFVVDENPNLIEFFKQYYISQEFPGSSVDIIDNFTEYVKLDNLTTDVLHGNVILSQDITNSSDVISVNTTKGYPKKYGLLKIDDEIITYTGITTNTFTGCVRGFSGIVDFHQDTNPEELLFSTSKSNSHTSGSLVINLSSLFLIEFYKKIKYTYTPGLENIDFSSTVNVANFIKQSKSFYQSKGTEESFKILFKVLYGEKVSILDLEKYLLKPSSSEFIRRQVVVAEALSGDPIKLKGQTIYQSSDLTNQASVSEVQVVTRKNKLYYELSLFVGYDSKSLVSGEFFIHPSTKCTEKVSIGSSIISVDSTIGFSNSGTILCNGNIIKYTGKTVNQFLNCQDVIENINPTDNLTSEEFVFGYENGDLNKQVKLRLTGVLYDLYRDEIPYEVYPEEYFKVKSVGEIIQNRSSNNKEILANSWVYNTSSRYEVDTVNGSIFRLKSKIDKSSLKIGDEVEILFRGTESISHSEVDVPFISDIFESTNSVQINNLINFNPNSGRFDLRRKLKKAKSLIVPLEYGNNKIISEVQNVYNENDEYLYVATSGLPSYEISKDIDIITIPYLTEEYLDGKNINTGYYSIIKIENNIFKTGDSIVYDSEKTDIGELISGNQYYIEILYTVGNISFVRFYESRSFIGSNNYIKFLPLQESDGYHTFILGSQVSRKIGIQNILRKFPIDVDLSTESLDSTKELRSLGLLKNGVEILNYQSSDKVYYGPLKKVKVLNGGNNYDVINVPYVEVSSPSIGTTALVQPVLSGEVKEVLIDPQDFDIDNVLTATITGGNGNGCQLYPYVSKRYRKVNFDGRLLSNGGGIDISSETITFLSDHNFKNGERIIYNSLGNDVGIGIFGGSNLNQNRTLVDGSSYFASIVNNKTIRLYETLSDFNSGINTVGFTTVNLFGIHEFRTVEKNTLSSVKVVNSGSGYTNRKLLVKPTGISTSNHTVYFPDHNFNDGDLIEYFSTGGAISGISTSNKFYILKIDNDTFRICDAGTTEDKTNYISKKYVKFYSTGSGYNVFKYPDIVVNLQVSYGSTFIGTITATPVVKGNIIDAYLYERGVGYGSSLLNFEKKPTISIKNGKNADLRPVISNGVITRVEIESTGSEYYSVPDLSVIGDGIGCKLRAVISNKKLVGVVVLSGGENYSLENTKIIVISSGTGALIDCNVRDLTLNDNFRFGNEILKYSNNKLQYGMTGYDISIGQNQFNDTGATHSEIIGWAYDGNPIYGSYGYANAENISLPNNVKSISSGYILDFTNVEDRPVGFPSGFFIDDYVFNNSGDLDIYNGRWCKTPEFPEGTYAYFATIDTNTLQSKYPYFIGKYFRSKFVKENATLDQNFDFNKSKLIRNTFPYKVGEKYANNDFIIESNEIVNQRILVESVSSGRIDGYEIISEGVDYKIGDLVKVDNENTNGGGFSASVSQISGKQIEKIEVSLNKYTNPVFTWSDSNVSAYISTSHELFDNDIITISGLSTFIANLEGNKLCNVKTDTISLFVPVPSGTGIVTDIYVSSIPSSLIVDDIIGISTENVKVLNIFNQSKILRVKRENIGISHTATTEIIQLKNKLTIPVKTNYFKSKLNDKVYFNPKSSVGVGTTSGTSLNLSVRVGDTYKNVSVETRSIYLPNHPFKTGQKVIIRKPSSSSSSLLVSSVSSGPTFSLPISGTFQTVYVIKKSDDYIGIVTNVGLTTNSSGLFFNNNGDDDYEYSIESNFEQVTGKIERIKTNVTLTTSHSLQKGDLITLKVLPNTTVGIGTSTSIKVTYNSLINKILINPIGFSSLGINSTTDQITVQNHGFITGDKIYYYPSSNIPSGLTTGFYYIYRHSENQFSLSETLYDATSSIPKIVSIGSTGGQNNLIYLINPPIKSYRNSSLKFDLSDTSLFGYNLKFFYDKNLNKEFKSVTTNGNFNISGFGTVGLGSTAYVILDYSELLPNEIYYSIEKNGVVVPSDKDVKNYSKIEYIDNAYNGTYTITGIGTTTFSFALRENPIILNYDKNNCDVLEYTTSSKFEKGGIKKIKTISPGYNYKVIPQYLKTESKDGKDALLRFSSSSIGKVENITIFNQGYEYSVDKTLEPQAILPYTLKINDNERVSFIEILDGGRNYISPPNLVVVNLLTGEKINSGEIEAIIQSTSINQLNIISQPNGLKSTEHQVFAIDNSNGILVISTNYSSSGIVTCTLQTPIAGFFNPPFSVGDKIWVEGIENESESGEGFNSSDYGYKFFTVSNYFNTNPASVEFNISGFSTNPGIAVTFAQTNPRIVNYLDYPKFKVQLEKGLFIPGEKILIKKNEEFIDLDLIVSSVKNDLIKFVGNLDNNKIDAGKIIKGSQSGTIGKIDSFIENSAFLKVGFYSEKKSGWQTETGKLNESFQVTSDNDYYQNLSYSIKSTKQYSEVSSSVNQLLHPSGFKNFADTQVSSSSTIFPKNVNSIQTIVLDIQNENRVDTINNFDLVADTEVLNGTSRFLKLKNKKLSNYINCFSNKVLKIDDISNLFSSVDNRQKNTAETKDILTYNENYANFLVQITDPNTLDIQITDLTTIKDNNNVFTLEKGTLYSSGSELAQLRGYIDVIDQQHLEIIPTNPFETDLDVKILKSNFSSVESGIGTYSVGFVNLSGSITTCGINTAKSIIKFDPTVIPSIYVSSQIIEVGSGEINLVDLYLTRENNNTYIAEYFIDTTDNNSLSGNYIGTFSSSISSGILSLNYKNNSSSNLIIKSKIVGFGSTSVGIGTYIFLEEDQPEGTEETAKYQSDFKISSGISTIINIDADRLSSLKSYARVSIGQTSSLHQLLFTQKGVDVFIKQYPILSVGCESGIGTFGCETDLSTSSIKFYPDSEFLSEQIKIETFSQIFYKNYDILTIPETLQYGNIRESISLAFFDSINGDRYDKKIFSARNKNTSIYAKTFNPLKVGIINQSTGVINIKNHFFNTGERLIYTPKSTFYGVPAIPLGIGATLNSVGVVTNILPSEVYAIKIDNDNFKISTRYDYSIIQPSIGVTFTSLGSGNAHQFEMYKKLEKTIITLDGVVQSPLTYTPISYTLQNNNGQIGIDTTIISISGISSIRSEEYLKIDNEYLEVVNVGFGTSSIGPISGIGTYNLVEVIRGSVGTSNTSHLDTSEARIYRGSYNIVENNICFSKPPKGSSIDDRNEFNLPRPKAQFTGRVFLRENYLKNVIYDDVSDQFTGIGISMILTVQGINTTGVQTGSGLVFLNNIFQTPTTENNSGNNYEFKEESGITKVVFTGITSSNGNLIISDNDINQNQLPRSGVIVSLASSGGLGYAPLVGSSVTAIVSGGSIIGIGTNGNWGSGYRNPVSVAVSEAGHVGSAATITAIVGAGGTLAFNIVNGGTGYTNPQIYVSEPSYSNLQVIGVSRRDIGLTTETGFGLTLDLEVGPSFSNVGIGSTYFSVNSFKVKKSGYGFRVGDVFKPIGLVTDAKLINPIEDFTLTVNEVFTDSFNAIEFGELDYIDDIKFLQNGSRSKFPLYYQGDLLSFKSDDPNLDLSSVLVIFIDGVIQDPGVSYEFSGGSSFNFTEPPKPENNVAIFFYRGTKGVDSFIVDVDETLKIGDNVRVIKNDTIPNSLSQNSRIIVGINTSDQIETNSYSGIGVGSETEYKPLNWTKQKNDLIINGDYIYKTRNSIESRIYPTSKIIKNFKPLDNEIFVDDAQFFFYEENNSPININNIDALIVENMSSVSCGLSAVVSIAGTIQSIIITNPGSGYIGTTVDIKISAPRNVSPGIGSIASAVASVSNGQLTTPILITNPGLGYTFTNLPYLIVETPNVRYEKINDIDIVQGFSGIVTGIQTTTGTGSNPLALKFNIKNLDSATCVDLLQNYPIYIYDTKVGTGVTSIDSSDSAIVGIGTTFLDNVYYVHSITRFAENAEIITNVKSNSSIIGISTSGAFLGRFSWGRLSKTTAFERQSPLSIGVTGFTISSGLSTFPTIQRRGYGFKDLGSLLPDIPI